MPDTARKTKAKIKMIEMGIIPALSGLELREMFSSMTDEERRVAKRKFRKLWRKIAKTNSKYSYLLNEKTKGQIPDDYSLKRRAKMVITKVLNDLD